MNYSSQISENRLLEILLDSNKMLSAAQFKLVRLKEGEMLFGNDKLLSHSYFPTTATISVFYDWSEKLCLEIEAIRNDGLCGLPSIIGSHLCSRCVVQTPGYAFRVETKVLDNAMSNSEFLKKILKYQQFRMSKISQVAICSRLHTVEQQYCRILLTIMDHLNTNLISITHKTIAAKLNVRRESISCCAANLQQKGIISTLRGKVIVLNRARLENLTCECYKVIHDEKKELLGIKISNHTKNQHSQDKSETRLPNNQPLTNNYGL